MNGGLGWFVRNPLLRAQASLRLRRPQVISSTVIAVLLAGCGVFLAALAKKPQVGFSMLEIAFFSAIVFLLLLRGPNRVTETVRAERQTGLLDFLRATPMDPWTQAFGYLLGCTAREHLLAGLFAGFALATAPLSEYRITDVALGLFSLWLCGLLYHAFALWIGLSVAHKRSAAGIVMGTLVCLLIVGINTKGVQGPFGLTPFPTLFALFSKSKRISDTIAFFGLSLHVMTVTVFVQTSLLGSFLFAAQRKLRSDDAPSFSRLGTWLFFAWLLFLAVGVMWPHLGAETTTGLAERHAAAPIVVVLFVVTFSSIGAVLLVSQVPTYLSRLRELKRLGTGAPRHWMSDGSRSEPVTLGLWSLLCVAIAVLLATSHTTAQALDLSVAALGLLSYLAFVQYSTEHVRLCHRTAAVGLLIVFVSHVVPFLLCLPFMNGNDQTVGTYIAAMSPFFAVIGAASQLTSGRPVLFTQTPPLQPLAVSIAVALVSCLLFYAKSRTAEQEIVRRLVPRQSDLG